MYLFFFCIVTCKAFRRSSVQFSRFVIFTVTSVPVGVCRARWTEVKLSNPLPIIRRKTCVNDERKKLIIWTSSKLKILALQENTVKKMRRQATDLKY